MYAHARAHHSSRTCRVQVNPDTNRKWLQMWRNIIVDWHCFHKSTSLDIATCELFENQAIRRRLNEEGRRLVAEDLIASGHAEWADGQDIEGQETRLIIHWKSPLEWGNIMHAWATDMALIGGANVMTIYDLRNGDTSSGTEFAGLEADVIVKAISALQEVGKAKLFEGENIDEIGVKFL